MTFSSLLLLALVDPASAGACCVGSISVVPTRTGECEKVVAGVSAGAELSAGRWDSAGALTPDTVHEQAATGNAGIGVRLNRSWQLGASLPLAWRHHATDSMGGWGGGVGDLTVVALADPIEEGPRIDGVGKAVPIIQFGFRAPTGRDWTEASGALLEDVTGKPDPALIGGVSLERTLDRWPWSVGSTVEVGVGSAVAPAATTYATLGRTLGPKWTVMGSLSHRIGVASMASAATWETRAAARLVTGQPLAWRAFVGADAALPVPGLGGGSLRTVAATAGLLLVR